MFFRTVRSVFAPKISSEWSQPDEKRILREIMRIRMMREKWNQLGFREFQMEEKNTKKCKSYSMLDGWSSRRRPRFLPIYVTARRHPMWNAQKTGPGNDITHLLFFFFLLREKSEWSIRPEEPFNKLTRNVIRTFPFEMAQVTSLMYRACIIWPRCSLSTFTFGAF